MCVINNLNNKDRWKIESEGPFCPLEFLSSEIITLNSLVLLFLKDVYSLHCLISSLNKAQVEELSRDSQPILQMGILRDRKAKASIQV